MVEFAAHGIFSAYFAVNWGIMAIISLLIFPGADIFPLFKFCFCRLKSRAQWRPSGRVASRETSSA